MLPRYELQQIQGLLPFNIALLGQRRSGKSVASAELAKYLSPRFDIMVSFLGTKNCNRELCGFINKVYDPRLNFVEFCPRVLSKLIEQQERLIIEGTPRECLVIFDDVFASNQKHVELLTQLFIRGRHFRISCITSAVSFATISKNCRRALDILFLYSSVCRSDNQVLSSEYIHQNLQTAQYALKNLPSYTALVIQTKRNQSLFQYKFDIGDDDSSDEKADSEMTEPMSEDESDFPSPNVEPDG